MVINWEKWDKKYHESQVSAQRFMDYLTPAERAELRREISVADHYHLLRSCPAFKNAKPAAPSSPEVPAALIADVLFPSERGRR
ncbi:MAG: hypothetical protein A3G34_07035 [Candidatus Lindowbacteria bacterium RIFCSPLOWO2_12_FULL_62_27]|nr:MAG: hypothetical protein A3G34_07035 [Candidatus Lindowbacteria bacterium RIFCSPLOWO2_12_FULL_62_27]